MFSDAPLLPGYGHVTGHAHELLFGFALAVVTGFLVSRASRLQLVALAGLWLLARASFLLLPASPLALGANAAFALLLGSIVIPPFLKGAKKLRNKVIAPLLAALCLTVPVFHLALVGMPTQLEFLVLQETVLLFALLMLFMGGRIIAPAAAGAIERAGGTLDARVQPGIEAALLIAMGLAVVALALPGGRWIAGVLVLIAAGLSATRLFRWRLWMCHARPDLWCLGLGYGWLVAGLLLLGLTWSLQLLPPGIATHAITVGALGTLTTAVMARVRITRNRLDPARYPVLVWIALFMTLATLLRLTAGSSVVALAGAAALWSSGLLLLMILLLRIPAR